MRYVAFILLLLPFIAFGQYPDGPSNKIRLGVQTTADGLAFTSNTGPTLNPANDTSAYLWLDTLAGRLWYWDNGAWDTTAAGLNYWTKDGTKIYYTDGYVGIGKDDPSATLHISDNSGTIKFNSELTGAYNIATFSNSANGNSANISYYGANDDLIITGGGLYIGNSYSPSVDIGEEDVFIEESLYLNRTATNDSDSILVVDGSGLVGYRTGITFSIHEENAQNTNLTISQSEVEDHAGVVCAINKQSAHVNDIEVELPAPTAAMAGKRITLNIEDDDSGAGEEININIAGNASRLRIYPATTQDSTYTPITGTGFIVLNLYVVYSHDAGAYIYDVQ